jgi:hypothetical protein
MEGAGEDAFLGSKIAVARVQGFQGTDLAAPQILFWLVPNILQGMALQNQEGIIIQLM